MSVGPESQVDPQIIEQERRRLSRRLEEVARLCETDQPPGKFYAEMLGRTLESLAAPAGAIWTLTAQGNLQQQVQSNYKEVGVESSDEARQSHAELLRMAISNPKAEALMPQSGYGPAEEGKPGAGNPTNFILLIVPMMQNGKAVGLIEVWQNPARPREAIQGFLQFISLMADLGVRYQRNQMLGQMTGQQQLWTQLEAFSRQIHGSLNPIEVAYLVANEGRRLIECDRVSVAARYGKKTKIEAVSGADVVETRSNLVQLMRKLCDAVLKWGEKLAFTGTKDDSLPPKVLSALDAYLAESPSKLLVVMPLKDDREKDSKKPPRTALLMECFEPPPEPQQIVARLEVVGRHAASALYNAVEHKRIPMRFLWLPLAKLQEGLGGKFEAISALVVVCLSLLVSVLVLVPYPLKMSATGNLLPKIRRVIYSPTPAHVQKFDVNPSETVPENRTLVQLHDYQLGLKIIQLKAEIESARSQAGEARNQAANPNNTSADKQRFDAEANKQQIIMEGKEQELKALVERTSADRLQPGYISLKAPVFTEEEANQLAQRREWTVLTGNFKEELQNKEVKPSEPIMRLGAKDGRWEIELRISQKYIGQILYAFESLKKQGRGDDPLDVDFLLRTDPTRSFKGKLYRDKVAGEANPNREDTNEPDPIVLAYVSIDDPSIAQSDRLPPELLLSGTEVTAKVRCGPHAMGYCLFYGVWEFVYEKIVFFF